jgi:3-hydroxyacyl-[acyl-carrier-protein] dehydratase
MSEQKLSFDINGIKRCQRNRHPVLFVDQVVDVVPGKSARGIKCFSYNEWFFPGHFDDEPNVPGFIQIECLVQTFIMTFLCLDEYQGMKTNFASINNVKFRRKIIPGETLISDAELRSFKRGLASGVVSSSVNGQPACSAEFVVTVPDVFGAFKPK